MYITMRFYLMVLLLSISTYGLLGGILQQKTAYLRPICNLLMQKWPNSPKMSLRLFPSCIYLLNQLILMK